MGWWHIGLGMGLYTATFQQVWAVELIIGNQPDRHWAVQFRLHYRQIQREAESLMNYKLCLLFCLVTRNH